MLVGLIGWRGMVGSVLIKRMVAEEDFKDFIVLSFTRVSRLTRASIEVFRLFFESGRNKRM